MIDYVSIKIPFTHEKALSKNPLLKFKLCADKDTGELEYYGAKYRYLYFKINYLFKTIIIKGSLHKFHHNVNHTDYTYNDVCQTINQLQKDFGINPKNAIIRRLEFGVNINLVKSPKDVIKNYLEHRRKIFVPMEVDKGIKILGNVCNKDRFKIKVYDKGEQYKLSKKLMRFELVSKKMYQLNKTWKVPIKTIHDLTVKDYWYSLKNILLTTYDEILKLEIVDLKYPSEQSHLV